MISKKSIVIFALGIFIFLPFIILKHSCIGIFQDNVALSYLGYVGSIISGLFTLFGVKWTIEDQNKKRREELSVTYKPIIVCELSIVKTPLEINEYGLSEDFTISSTCNFRNVGLGEAKITSGHVKVYEEFCYELDDSPKVIPPNYNYEFNCNYLYNVNIIKDKKYIYTYHVICDYCDFMGNKYESSFQYDVIFKPDVRSEEKIWELNYSIKCIKSNILNL